MNTPPNLRRQSDRYFTGLERMNDGREVSRIFVEEPRFEFTELFLSEAEVDRLCVIPCLQPKPAPPVVRWMPAQRPVGGKRPMAPHSLQAVMAAGLAWLALPGCSCAPGEAPSAVEVDPVEVTAQAEAPAPAVVVHQVARREAVSPVVRREAAAPVAEAPHRARVAPVTVRPTVVTELAMLDQAKTAMDVGHYRAALGIYKHLLYRQPTQVDALFGAALASHELRDSKGADVYLKRALTLQPNHPLANILAGFTEQMGHHYDGARTHYTRFLSIEGEGPRADEIRSVIASLPDSDSGGGTVTGQR